MIMSADQPSEPKLVKIEITSIPDGAAPLHIREQWIGCQLLAIPNIDPDCDTDGSAPSQSNMNGFAVPPLEYIRALQAPGKEEALIFWSKNLPPELLPFLVFGKSFCKVIS